jgi:trehalose 2-sulfotransferase
MLVDEASERTPRPPAHTYIIASTPRTGSYLLCEGLGATRIAGRPSEVFCPKLQGVWRRRWSLPENVDFPRYFEAAVHHLTTPSGVCGVKIHWMQLEPLARYAPFSGQPAQVLNYLYPEATYINLVRRDTRAQAISYFRALATHEWWRTDGVRNRRITGNAPLFDADAILSAERDLIAQQSAWQEYFATNELEPLVIEYEVLVDDYQGQVARVLSLLGLDASAAGSIPLPRLMRQADNSTLQWQKQLDSHVNRQ